jgi:hypothetical protein
MHITVHTSVASLGAGVLLMVLDCHTQLSLKRTWLSVHSAHSVQLYGCSMRDLAFTEWLGVLDITKCLHPPIERAYVS